MERAQLEDPKPLSFERKGHGLVVSLFLPFKIVAL